MKNTSNNPGQDARSGFIEWDFDPELSRRLRHRAKRQESKKRRLRKTP